MKTKAPKYIRIAGVNQCSAVNGDGCRVVVFVQGCGRHCKGCQNPDTWDFKGGERVEISQLAIQIRTLLTIHPLDGVTLSGGDPFYSQRACCELLRQIGDDVNVWIYTGFRHSDMCYTELARRADVIVDGRYIEELKCEGQMYGSSNQRIIRKGKEI